MIPNIMPKEMVDDLNERVGASLDLQRRINLATGLTAVITEPRFSEPNVIVYELKAIDKFVVATVSASWQKRQGKGYWRLGTIQYFDLNDLKSLIGNYADTILATII